MKYKLIGLITLLNFSLINCDSPEFKLKVTSPPILAKDLEKGLDLFIVMPGIERKDYEKNLVIKSLTGNKSGCKKYADQFSSLPRDTFGIILFDQDNCSLSDKIHYAQQAGASVLMLKNLDDKLDEAYSERNSFEGVKIPVFLLKNSQANQIFDVLNASGQLNQLEMKLIHQSQIDYQQKLIQIYMSSYVVNNPVVQFLKDLQMHQRLIGRYQMIIKFSIGFCKSCQEKQFMKPDNSCLSGGRYCVINSDFKTNEAVKETLRQICVREEFGNEKLINYLYQMKFSLEQIEQGDQAREKQLEILSRQVCQRENINYEKIQDCFNKSFEVPNKEDQLNISLDDNILLKKEQKEFFEITKKVDIFPLIIINNQFYDQTINIREFIKFGCDTKMFDCRNFKFFKKIFFLVIMAISFVIIFIFIMFCRRIMKKKMESELSIKVNEAIQKYLTVSKA